MEKSILLTAVVSVFSIGDSNLCNIFRGKYKEAEELLWL
jgi:hypothetical protein